jgi:hypothetical protein
VNVRERLLGLLEKVSPAMAAILRDPIRNWFR